MINKYFGKQAEGKLQKTGLSYTARFMKRSELDKNIELQDNVMNALHKEGKTNYVIPKSREYLERLLTQGNAIIGIFVQSDEPDVAEGLVAHMLLTYPQTVTETGLTDPAMLPQDDVKSMAVVANVLVHPWFRGNRLMEKMLCEGLALAAGAGKKNALAEICIDNPYSWGVFLDCGFVIYAEGIDPADGAELVYVHKPLDSRFVYSDTAGDIISLTLFDQDNKLDPAIHQRFKDLIAQGYHALDYNRRNKCLELRKCLGRTVAAPVAAPTKGLNPR